LGERLRYANGGSESEVAPEQSRVYGKENRADGHVATTREFLILWGLFVATFLAATLLPGGSEAALFGVLKLDPGLLWPALAVATAGNTLGGLTSYFIGRSIPQHRTLKGLDRVRRHGTAILLSLLAAHCGRSDVHCGRVLAPQSLVVGGLHRHGKIRAVSRRRFFCSVG
jgi:hypothetical protein